MHLGDYLKEEFRGIGVHMGDGFRGRKFFQDDFSLRLHRLVMIKMQ